jgi:hypothetical protein
VVGLQLVRSERDDGRRGDGKEQAATVRLVALHRPVTVGDRPGRVHVDQLVGEDGRRLQKPAELSVGHRARNDDRRERERSLHAG